MKLTLPAVGRTVHFNFGPEIVLDMNCNYDNDYVNIKTYIGLTNGHGILDNWYFQWCLNKSIKYITK